MKPILEKFPTKWPTDIISKLWQSCSFNYSVISNRCAIGALLLRTKLCHICVPTKSIVQLLAEKRKIYLKFECDKLAIYIPREEWQA